MGLQNRTEMTLIHNHLWRYVDSDIPLEGYLFQRYEEVLTLQLAIPMAWDEVGRWLESEAKRFDFFPWPHSVSGIVASHYYCERPVIQAGQVALRVVKSEHTRSGVRHSSLGAWPKEWPFIYVQNGKDRTVYPSAGRTFSKHKIKPRDFGLIHGLSKPIPAGELAALGEAFTRLFQRVQETGRNREQPWGSF
jgi:hypothetical protein